MKKKIKCLITLIIGCVIFFLAACPGVNPKDTDPDTGDEKTPQIVKGVYSTPLEYNDRIHLTWEPVDAFDSYKIYRYTDKSEISQNAVFTSDMEVFDDIETDALGAVADKVYYYKVSSVLGGIESEKSVNFVPGLYSSSVDNFEPNDDSNSAYLLVQGTYDVLIYSFDEGEVQDRDFYALFANSGICTITIEIEPNSPLLNQLQLVYGGNTDLLNTANEEIGLTHSVAIDSSSVTLFRIEFQSASPVFDAVEGYRLKFVKY